MADIVVNGNTSGAVTLSAPAVAGTVTVTLPATSGTMLTTASSTGVSGSAISSGTVAEAYGGTGTSTGYYGFKNRIINGAMVIDQRNAGASVSPAASVYTLDRWQAVMNAASAKYSVQQTPSATESGFATRVGAGFQSYLAVTSLSAYTVGAGEIMAVQQIVEGFNIADLAWGTANAKTVTLSFWVYSSLTGTFGGAIRQGSGARSYPYSYTISAANTWEQKTITIAGDTSGTYASGNTAGLIISWGFGVGATYSGTAGSWASANYVTATGATSVVGTNGATFYITGVQLEKGSTATSFDYRSIGTELALCQRYFYKTFPQQVAVVQNSGTAQGAIYYIVVLGGANYMGTPVYFPVTMRATPTTLTFYNPSAVNAKWRNTSLGTDSGSTTVPQNLSQYGFLAINNPQVVGDAVNNSIIIHATAEAEL